MYPGGHREPVLLFEFWALSVFISKLYNFVVRGRSYKWKRWRRPCRRFVNFIPFWTDVSYAVLVNLWITRRPFIVLLLVTRLCWKSVAPEVGIFPDGINIGFPVEGTHCHWTQRTNVKTSLCLYSQTREPSSSPNFKRFRNYIKLKVRFLNKPTKI